MLLLKFQKSLQERKLWDLKSEDIVFGFVGTEDSQFKLFLKAVVPLLREFPHFKILALNIFSNISAFEREEIQLLLVRKNPQRSEWHCRYSSSECECLELKHVIEWR